jgi:hypothetical protein
VTEFSDQVGNRLRDRAVSLAADVLIELALTGIQALYRAITAPAKVTRRVVGASLRVGRDALTAGRHPHP